MFNTGECGSFVTEQEPKKPKIETIPTPPETVNETTISSSPPSAGAVTATTNKRLPGAYVLYSTVIFLVIALILGYYFQPQQKHESNATPTSYKLPDMPPKSTAEFHANWKDLSMENKFKYLKVL